VFHFLTAATDRAACVCQVAHAVKPGGHVIQIAGLLDRFRASIHGILAEIGGYARSTNGVRNLR